MNRLRPRPRPRPRPRRHAASALFLAAAVGAPSPAAGSSPDFRRYLDPWKANPLGDGAARGGRAEPVGLDLLPRAPGCGEEDLLEGADGGVDPSPSAALLPPPRPPPPQAAAEEIQLALPAPLPSGSGPPSVLSPLTGPFPWDVDPDLVPAPVSARSGFDGDGGGRSFRKTGTTIVGCLADGGSTVVLAADTRATDGTTVADAACEKVHRIADNVWCCGAGTSGDIDALVRKARYSLLLRGAVAGSIGNLDGGGGGGRVARPREGGDGGGAALEQQQRPWLPPASVAAAVRFLRDVLYEGGGGVGANLVLGGYDPVAGRAVLAALHPHGSVDSVPFAALGSGGLAAISVLESRHRPDLTVEDAVELVRDAVGSGISNDLGSGSQVDLCVIGPGGVTYRRAVVPEEGLPVTEGDRASDSLLRERNAAGDARRNSSVRGVNGFGSLGYHVKSRRIVLRDENVADMGTGALASDAIERLLKD